MLMLIMIYAMILKLSLLTIRNYKAEDNTEKVDQENAKWITRDLIFTYTQHPLHGPLFCLRLQ
jgi:hypothetical protein